MWLRSRNTLFRLTPYLVQKNYKFLLKSHTAAEAKAQVAIAAEGFWKKVGVKPKTRKCIIKDITNLDKEYSVIDSASISEIIYQAQR